MYAQLVETGLNAVRTAAEMPEDERAFQAWIDADIKVEPKDWMPAAYRKTLIQQISQQAREQQGLPASDLLSDAGRRQTHLTDARRR